MSLVQRVVLRLAGRERAAAIEAESRAWLVTCGACGDRRSYWDLGGVRYGASSRGKKIRTRCDACGHRGWSDVTRSA